MDAVATAREWYLRKDRTMTNAEKRSVHTDALETLGTIIENGERDAIHLAVEPVTAGEKLHPGQDICIHGGEARNVGMGKALGIVDPFLRGPVSKGDKFWLVVYPRQITSLRHVWSHPDFSETTATPIDTAFHEEWVRGWCESNEIEYDGLIEAFKTGCADLDDDGDYRGYAINDPEYFLVRGSDASGSFDAAIWDHLEALTGVKARYRPTFFSCSC